MKSKEELHLSANMPKTDLMKKSSFNFLENERTYNMGVHNYQTDECDTTHTYKKRPDIQVKSNDNELLKNTKSEESISRTTSEVMSENSLITTETHVKPGRHSPKRYTTTCFFQPKPNPVSYSETVIITIGSKKKHYFDTVLYQTKLVPYRWTESMTTKILNTEEKTFEATHNAFVEEPKYHYMSLEPQQLNGFNDSTLEKITV